MAKFPLGKCFCRVKLAITKILDTTNRRRNFFGSSSGKIFYGKNSFTHIPVILCNTYIHTQCVQIQSIYNIRCSRFVLVHLHQFISIITTNEQWHRLYYFYVASRRQIFAVYSTDDIISLFCNYIIIQLWQIPLLTEVGLLGPRLVARVTIYPGVRKMTKLII